MLVCVSVLATLLKTDVLLDNWVCTVLAIEEATLDDVSECIEVDDINVLALVAELWASVVKTPVIEDSILLLLRDINVIDGIVALLSSFVAAVGWLEYTDPDKVDVDWGEDVEPALVAVIVIRYDVKRLAVAVLVVWALLIELELVTLDKILLWLVPVCIGVVIIETVFEDVSLADIDDKVDGTVAVFAVELPMVWVVYVCDEDWLDDVADRAVPVCIIVLPIVWLVSV